MYKQKSKEVYGKMIKTPKEKNNNNNYDIQKFRMTSSSSSSTIGENMQFVDKMLVRMEKDELASLLNISLDCLDEGKELAISHAKLTEFANEGMLQPCVGSSELSKKNEMNNYLETTNDKVVSSNECCTNTSIPPVSDTQTFNSVKCIKASEDNEMSDVMSDQSDCTEPSILKIKRCGRRRTRTSNMISSDSCETESVSKQLQHSKRNKNCNSTLEKFVFPVIRESRKRKIDSTVSSENKSQSKMLKSTSLSDNSETKIPSFDRQQQISTKNKGEKTVKHKNTETSNVRVSTKEINRENLPLSRRLRVGTKASLRLFSHVNKSNSSTKHKTSVYLNAKQNKTKLNKSTSKNCKVPIEKPAEDLLDRTEQNRTHNTSDTQKVLSPSKVKKITSHTSPLKLRSIEKSDTKVKSKHERLAQSPSNGNELQNVLIAQKNSEENLNSTGTKTRKKKRCEDKSQKLSCSKDDGLKSDCVETISEPIILGLKSSESDINDSSNFKQDKILQPKKTNKNQQKKQDENIQDIRRPLLTDGMSFTPEKQAIVSKKSQITDSYEMQNKDDKINKVPDLSSPLTTINVTGDSVVVSDIGQVASIEWLSTNDDDTGKESSIEDDTPAELDLFDCDCIQVCSISENEYSTLSSDPQKLSSPSLEDDSTEELLSEDQEKDAGKSDEEACSSDKYKKLKEQFQRAGLDLDKVAQSIDEQRLKKVIHKAGKDSGMLLRLPHFCPCSNKQVGQCLIIINSLTQYIKEKNKKMSLTD